jgi:hypothetical protein
MDAERSRVGKQPYPTIAILSLATLLAMAPLRSAYAYIDPNSAGPLYQFLFPLLIAIGGGIAAMRRIIKQLWSRTVRACVGVFRQGRDEGSGRPPRATARTPEDSSRPSQ